MRANGFFDPERDSADRIREVRPQPTPWRRRAAIVEGKAGGMERPGDRSGCTDCGDREDAASSARRGGFFPYLRHNRSLAILLIDTVIVVALFFIVLFVMVPSMGRIRIDDIRINTVVDTTESMVIVRGEFYQRSDREDDAEVPETRIIAIAAGGEVLRDLAPAPGHERTLEIRFPRSRIDENEFTIEIFVGNQQRVLTRSTVD